MYRTSRLLCVVPLLVLLLGCERLQDPYARINQAIPPSPEAEMAMTRLGLTQAAIAIAEDRQPAHGLITKQDAQQRAQRLAIRAMTCAAGHKPRWWHSSEDIRTRFNDTRCFAEADAALTAWADQTQAGILLAAPPWRSVPDSPVGELVASQPILDISQPAKAGIAVLLTADTYEVFDWHDGQSLARHERDQQSVIHDISDNGRLISLYRRGEMQLMELASGRVLYRLRTRHPLLFIGNAGILVREDRDHAPHLLDLSNGQRQVIAVTQPETNRVAPGTQPGLHVLLGRQQHAVISVGSSSAGATVNVVMENNSNHRASNWPRGNLTADGKHYIGHGPGPVWIDLGSLVTDQPMLQTLRPALTTPTAQANTAYVHVYARNAGGNSANGLLYDKNADTLAPLQLRTQHAAALKWLWPLKHNALVDGIKLRLQPTLASEQPPMPREHYLQNQQQAQQYLLDPSSTLSRQQQMQGALGISRAQANAASHDARLSALAQGAVIEAVGVYEGNGAQHGHGRARQPGTVDVMVKAGPPVILVLTAYEPVIWKIQPERGARVLAVLHGGYHQGIVQGAGNAHTHDLGRLYTYQRQGGQFSELDNTVHSLAGKRINRFQGRYAGGHFRVGG